nr:MAG TPA: hypothetical protein [Caudoviricetes sp.]
MLEHLYLLYKDNQQPRFKKSVVYLLGNCI